MSLATGRASELPSARRRCQAKHMPTLGVEVADDVDVEERTGQHNAGHGNTLERSEPGRLRKAGLGIPASLLGGEERSVDSIRVDEICSADLPMRSSAGTARQRRPAHRGVVRAGKPQARTETAARAAPGPVPQRLAGSVHAVQDHRDGQGDRSAMLALPAAKASTARPPDPALFSGRLVPGLN
jgi:hypothetical protein